ncbi:uncharacterized protein LAESUDRAFT_744694 [Laetiporus sulphureus 93-53]|uniref:Bromodomain associated domain-containing protein n=1 Tax=Laetiporus sulphureus 93-53 TaxID=1314785 RepID=A0A165CRX1_9APHY|nr:uncharacterized protein LAESUDRAFT_744694 [Laetiporus sulphureus 93-53]KZT03328.1 hypothetical protein LAESUDRAFT_744694 [Laetiporus sulphureus 93-53]
MDGGARKLLETVTFETLHANNFSRSSTQASQVLTDLLVRYLALLTTTCAKYAQHAGRLSLSVRDAVSALDELGVGVDELSQYYATDGRDLSRYAIHTARRMEDLGEFRAALATGLRVDRDDAISLFYGRVPSPMLSEEEYEDEELGESEEDKEQEESTEAPELSSEGRTQEDAMSLKRKADDSTIPPLSSPKLPPSPISNPSTPPRKRPRTASWRPPSYVPDHLPPFPTNSPAHSPSPAPLDLAVVPNPIKVERLATPPPSQITQSASSADYLTTVPYEQSTLASLPSWHLPTTPSSPPTNGMQTQSRLPTPQVQPALLGAYHHVLTHPPPPLVTSVNPARYRVALGFLAQAEAQPRWDPTPSLFSTTAPNVPRVAAMGPSFPVQVSKGPPTPTEVKNEEDKKSNLPFTPPKPVASTERITPLLSLQTSRIPTLARQVLSGPVYSRVTRLTHPPVLQRGTQRLVYGPGVSAPWNTNAPPTPPAPPNAGKGKEGVNGVSKDAETPSKPLPDARLYATWDYEQKRFHEPLIVRRGRGSVQAGVNMPPLRSRGESRTS